MIEIDRACRLGCTEVVRVAEWGRHGDLATVRRDCVLWAATLRRQCGEDEGESVGEARVSCITIG